MPKRNEEHNVWLAASGISSEGSFWRPKSASCSEENKGL